MPELRKSFKTQGSCLRTGPALRGRDKEMAGPFLCKNLPGVR